MAEPLPAESLLLLPAMPVEPHVRKLALTVALASIVVFLVIAPFAKVQLAPVTAFIPIYESALLINDLITAVLLFGHFSILRSRALLVLASGYLFTAIITIPHALTFPGLFSPTGLLGAGSQSTAWIYTFWHSGFPLCIIAYSLLNHQDREKARLIPRPYIAIWFGIATAVVMAGGFTWLTTVNHDVLPAILVSGHYSFMGHVVLTSTWVITVLALSILWRYKTRSMLDLWLLVVMCAWLSDIALSAVLNAGRFDVGWYAGRSYGLVAASCVLIALLLENNKLYARLVIAHENVLVRTADLQRLNTQNEDRATQYAEALEELHYKEEEIRAVVQNILDCVITIDSNGIIRSANPAVERIFGYSVTEVISLDILTLMPDFKRDEHIHRQTDNAKILDTNSEVEGLHKDGRHIPLELSINDFVVHGERLFIGTLRDISERKRFIMELTQARSSAEQANRAKSTFLANMSHELRTPLNAILGFAQVLVSESLPVTAEQRKDFTFHIVKAGKHLLALINEILDLARVESGTLSLSLESVSLTETMRTCQEMIKPMADERDIRLVFPADEHLYVVADRTRLKQVLLNLLSNAVKYNRDGSSVVVGYTALPSDSMRITIQDNGAGLDSAQLEQLFQPFNRLGQESGKEEGTGIGLIVTKRLVELMGGTIGVTSTAGVGSVFWIELQSTRVVPYTDGKDIAMSNAIADTPANTEQNATPLRTILYVEDNAANLILIRELIAFRPNLRLITATDGKLGIGMARAHKPAVILMDISLPGMSGDEAMLILRADPVTTQTPVIALSANAMPCDVAQSMSTGFFRYLTKPINTDEFFEVLDSALKFSEKDLFASEQAE
ncbi:MAG TPA: MASE4 domain-containing protein [Burkholderiaceae bacterium]|jgi:PAS domain S-box-containing protein